MAEYNVLDLKVWEDFLDKIRSLREQEASLKAKLGYVPNLLFRGQREAGWKLETTLERSRPNSLSLSSYYHAISRTLPQIEAHTQEKWQIPLPPQYDQMIRGAEAELNLRMAFPAYDYMAYLRHHGFPSPLLDWSKSAYIAAFFAFRQAGDPAGHVAIFAYRETSGGGKAGMVGKPEIIVQGPYVRTHRRHFLQQCQYTVCIALNGPGPQWHYTSHEDVFAATHGPRLQEQDQLWKFTLPVSERERVLSYLDEHNLNAYSLFGSEDTLMETMALKELK